jgi:DNA-binding MarR family transcriptional regulator
MAASMAREAEANDESETGEVSLAKLQDLVGYHLRRAAGAFVSDYNRALEGTGMRQLLFAILCIIEANPGIGQGLVGKALGIQRANMVSLVNELVDRGMAARNVSRSDRRAFELYITEAGASTLSECAERIARHEARMLIDFTDDERATLLGLLSRIEARET